MNPDSKIYIAGHNGMVGSAIWRHFLKNGYTNLIGVNSYHLDLRKQNDVIQFFEKTKPEYVVVAAAKVGGILANDSRPAEFIYDNLYIQTNLIDCSHKYNVKKLLFLGSSCIYPKFAKQPIVEDELLNGHLEPTNDAYAIAKIAGIKMCQSYHKQYGCNYISAMPCNLYGINDNFDLTTSHVLPALIRKFHEAKIKNLPHVTCWGSGSPKREFLYVDDLANACLFLMNVYDDSKHINVGYGTDISIRDLVETIRNVVNYEGEVVWDTSKPDGTPKKLMDSSKLFSMGWKPSVSLDEGIEKTYSWVKNNVRF